MVVNHIGPPHKEAWSYKEEGRDLYRRWHSWHECVCGAKTQEKWHDPVLKIITCTSCNGAGECTHCVRGKVEIADPTNSKKTVKINCGYCGGNGNCPGECEKGRKIVPYRS